ncbi:hypothetical protein ACQR1W_27465 [Bradyrhizobium sp. HKCCYLS1011]|uniref:hypothetical protein n=1 Tax=Bradyrhizobium sp. HKCCYLS1011 TaxID=3420733 RepID=UPI003EB97F2A
MEIARSLKPIQDGRLNIEKISGPIPTGLGAAPAEYKAGLDYAIAQGRLWLHESDTHMKITDKGAELFAINAQEN